MASRKSYTQEFKQEAVTLAKERGSVAQTARDLGISGNVLHVWKNAIEAKTENPFPGHGNPRDAELAKLQRENNRLMEENEILKKAVGIFTKPLR